LPYLWNSQTRRLETTLLGVSKETWLFDEGNYDKYRENLSTVDWDNLFHGNDVNTCHKIQ
jgi:hypothetical protein